MTRRPTILALSALLLAATPALAWTSDPYQQQMLELQQRQLQELRQQRSQQFMWQQQENNRRMNGQLRARGACLTHSNDCGPMPIW